jgi:hypothetical protein
MQSEMAMFVPVVLNSLQTLPSSSLPPKDPLLQQPQRRINEEADHKRDLESQITRLLRDWPNKPNLVNARHEQPHA